MTKPMQKQTTMKLTDDEWYPCFTLGGEPAVSVSFLQFYDRSGYRVCVWGADDFGMELDFSNAQKGEARGVYRLLLGMPKIQIKFLEKMGFVLA